jgi:hypothetical protein
VFDYPKVLAVLLMSDNRQRFTLDVDEEAHTFTLSKRTEPDWPKAVLTFALPEPGAMTISGIFEGKTVQAKLVRTDDKDFLLRSRGFNWINEYPFNR